MNNLERIIGKYTSGKPGPLLFITAGVHGNEPSGVLALQKVFTELGKSKATIEGTIVGVSGNLKALQKEVRFIDEDLNRTWTIENIQQENKNSAEKKEMFELIKVLQQFPAKDYTQRYFLDCHTTSSASAPYISVQEVGENDAWAHHFPTYIIRGFSDIVSGTIDHYMSRTGLTGFVFEGGQHESTDAIDHHEGMIWLAIAQANGLQFEELSSYLQAIKKLSEEKGAQKTFEIVYRHSLENNDTFTMEPGFKNFQPIQKGDLLAHHNGKEIVSEWDAYIFMPLYQAQGNDGFFVVKNVK